MKNQSLLALLAASKEDWYSYSVDGAESPSVEPIEHCGDENQANGLCCLESGDEYRPWSSRCPLGGALYSHDVVLGALAASAVAEDKDKDGISDVGRLCTKREGFFQPEAGAL